MSILFYFKSNENAGYASANGGSDAERIKKWQENELQLIQNKKVKKKKQLKKVNQEDEEILLLLGIIQ